MTRPQERLDTALAEIFRNLLTDVHTAMPGQVTAFDSVLQTCSVQPCLKRKYVGEDDAELLPVIEDVPVLYPGSNDLWLTYELKEDSYVLLVCSERAIADWMITGGTTDPLRQRKHNLSDAVAIPGLIPTPAILNGVDVDAIAMRNRTNTAKVSVETNTTITVENAFGSFVIDPAGLATINAGSTPVAKVGSTVVATATTDPAFWVWFAAVGTATGAGAPPTSLTSAVTDGSPTVLVP
jgi:hypothetical protein